MIVNTLPRRFALTLPIDRGPRRWLYVKRNRKTNWLKPMEAGTRTVIGFFIAQVLLVFEEQKGSESTLDVAPVGEVV
jgi:hypothetical protein